MMRFRRWHRPEPYGDTPRKRAAFLRKQRREREALPLFAEQIAAGQHGVDEEMVRRAIWWDAAEKYRRGQRATRWREARARLFALPDELRRRVREIWQTCPYPADPAGFADFLYQIGIGKLDPYRPPWIFHQELSPRITRDPGTFGEAFRRIGRRNVAPGDELLYCGNLGSGILFLTRRVRQDQPNDGTAPPSGQPACGPDAGPGACSVEIEVCGQCSQADLDLIGRLAQASNSRRVRVRRKPSVLNASAGEVL